MWPSSSLVHEPGIASKSRLNRCPGRLLTRLDFGCRDSAQQDAFYIARVTQTLGRDVHGGWPGSRFDDVWRDDDQQLAFVALKGCRAEQRAKDRNVANAWQVLYLIRAIVLKQTGDYAALAT